MKILGKKERRRIGSLVCSERNCFDIFERKFGGGKKETKNERNGRPEAGPIRTFGEQGKIEEGGVGGGGPNGDVEKKSILIAENRFGGKKKAPNRNAVNSTIGSKESAVLTNTHRRNEQKGKKSGTRKIVVVLVTKQHRRKEKRGKTHIHFCKVISKEKKKETVRGAREKNRAFGNPPKEKGGGGSG